MDPIAVVGIGLRFPQNVTTLDEFWNLLLEKRCTSSEWPKQRLNVDAFHDPVRREPSSITTHRGHFLSEDPGLFDATFFSIQASEAAAMDPQQCMLLETTYRALENAGLPLSDVRGSKTGVYVGSMCDDHRQQLLQDVNNVPQYAATGTSGAVLANRISWYFDFTGPSLTLDTACSSSLIALHLACQSLVVGDTSMAIVGGTNVLSGVTAPIPMTRMGFLSPTGKCYSFDERADGYARGEGVGVVVLKRLSDALANNDTIRAVIRSTGTNQDGHTPGITVPNSSSQANLIKATYKKANLDLAATRYFESHGTGTAVGDPLEAAAIGEVFSEGRSSESPLYVGTLKPNIGHLEGASGIAGLIKTVLVLEHGLIPPNTNLSRLNNKIDTRGYHGLRFPTEPTPWPQSEIRRASINSFGFAGSNAHVVVDDAHSFLSHHALDGHHSAVISSQPDLTNGTNPKRPVLVSWSARNDASLADLITSFETWSNEKSHLAGSDRSNLLQNLVYTLSCRRTLHEWRSYAILDSYDSLKTLGSLVSVPSRSMGSQKSLFVFSGQGTQYHGMGLQLMSWDRFRETLQACDREFARLGCTWSLFDVLNDPEVIIDHPSYSQPLCTALQVALVDLLKALGIMPACVVGHSSGEIAAAYCTSAISLEAACKISFLRGQLSATLLNSEADGTMLAVALSDVDVADYICRVRGVGCLTVACINSPQNVTVSGSRECIIGLKALLDDDNVFCRELNIGVAYHSPDMRKIAAEYHAAIGTLTTSSSPNRQILMVSSVTGRVVDRIEDLCSPEYWVQNLVHPVRFSDAVAAVTRPSHGPQPHVDLSDVIEIGPHNSLQRYVSEIRRFYGQGVRYMAPLSRFDTSPNTFLQTMGNLHCSGYPVRLDLVNRLDLSRQYQYRCLTDLPVYTFKRTRRLHQSTLNRETLQRPHFPLPFLGAPTPGWGPHERRWRQTISLDRFPWLVDHQMNHTILFPFTGMLVLALEVAMTVSQKSRRLHGVNLTDAFFSNPIIIDTTRQKGVDIETVARSTLAATEQQSSYVNLAVRFFNGDTWIEAFHGTIELEYEESLTSQELSPGRQSRLSQWRRRYHTTAGSCHRRIRHTDIYSHFRKIGMQYGPTFQGLEEVLWSGDQIAIGKVSTTKSTTDSSVGSLHYLFHPAVLDALLQVAWVTGTEGASKLIPTSVPTRLRRIWFSNAWFGRTGMDDDELIACHETLPFGFGGLDVSAIILNKAKEPIMAIEHLNCNVSAREHVDTQQDAPRQLCYSIVTKPAISAMSSRHLMGRLQKSCAPLVEFLDLLAHAKPRLRIFDATLGTSLIAYIHGMKTDIHSRIQDYTLVSSSENMDSLQAGSGTGWNLTLVDSNFGPGSSIQDLPNQSFDVIFCSNSTFDGKASHQMKLLAALLVSGGKLLHLFPPETDSHHPRINDFAWPSLFPNRYFQTEELSVKGSHINESGYLGFVVADPREQAQNDAHQPTYTILAGDSDLQHAMAAHISTELTSHGNSGATIRSFHDLRSGLSVSKTHLILLLEVGQEFLRCLNEQDFQTLKHVLSTVESAHWISKPQAQWDARTTASLDMVKGFARVLRSEAPHRPFTIISLEQGSTISEDAVTVSKLLAQNDISGLDNETEYFMKDGIAHVQRVVSNPDLDKLIFESTVDQPRSAPVAEIGPVELRIERPGVFDSLNCIPVSQSLDLAPDEVEVDAHAFGLNFKDVVVALGKLPQSQMGYECAGVITRAGAKARLKPGTRVMVAHDQGMKTLNRYRCDLVVEIPAGLSFEEAAAIPTVGTTAYYSLVYRARLQQNETVLVHSATGATGQMCVQLALLLGAEVYATVGSAEKKTFLVQHYGLREDHIFYSRDTSFAPSVMAATEGRGVDVLVNSLAGDRLQASWEIMAPFGRFLELGRTEIVSNSYLPMARFANNVSFMAIGLDDLLPRRPPLVQEMLSAVADLMETGKLCLPYPIRTYKLSEAERAFRHLMSGTTMGKLVLTVDPTDVVKTRTVKSTYKCLRSDATYVIAGGLGGLGRSAAKWMAGKGARHLLLLSRSGPQSESAKTLVRDLERAGVRVAAPTCDVSNEEQLASVLSSCQQTMPPFRGCIQGTMVLRDALFEKMTFEDWSTSIEAKLEASYNLDKLLPRGLDFFVLLSSLSGIIGLSGQANYAAGNAYQDGLARARIERGEHAVSLDLGAMDNVGVIAENEHVGRQARAQTLPIKEVEFHALLETFCLVGTDRPLGEEEIQTLVGLHTPSFFRTEGLDVPPAYSQPFFSHVNHTSKQSAESSGMKASELTAINYRHRFKVADSAETAATVVVEGLVAKLSKALSAPEDSIDSGKPLYDYGVDSLVAVEIRNWFIKDFSSEVPIFSFLGAPSIRAVGDAVTEASTLRK